MFHSECFIPIFIWIQWLPQDIDKIRNRIQTLQERQWKRMSRNEKLQCTLYKFQTASWNPCCNKFFLWAGVYTVFCTIQCSHPLKQAVLFASLIDDWWLKQWIFVCFHPAKCLYVLFWYRNLLQGELTSLEIW